MALLSSLSNSISCKPTMDLLSTPSRSIYLVSCFAQFYVSKVSSHDFLYGDGALPWSRAARQAWSVSFLVRSGWSSEKGGSPPFPPLLAPTLGWPPRDGLVSAPQLLTPGWPLRERRETPPRQCVVFFLGGDGTWSGGIFGGEGFGSVFWVEYGGMQVGWSGVGLRARGCGGVGDGDGGCWFPFVLFSFLFALCIDISVEDRGDFSGDSIHSLTFFMVFSKFLLFFFSLVCLYVY